MTETHGNPLPLFGSIRNTETHCLYLVVYGYRYRDKLDNGWLTGARGHRYTERPTKLGIHRRTERRFFQLGGCSDIEQKDTALAYCKSWGGMSVGNHVTVLQLVRGPTSARLRSALGRWNPVEQTGLCIYSCFRTYRLELFNRVLPNQPTLYLTQKCLVIES
jgi:hypothetical protein